MAAGGGAAAPEGWTIPDSVKEAYERDGYAVIEGWWSPEQIADLKAAGESILRDFDPSVMSVFSTDEQVRTSDDWFLESGSHVRCFLEEKALAKGPDGVPRLTVPKEQAVNKAGHALHELIPAFRAVSLEDPRVAAICRALGYEHPVVPQSMIIYKSPRIGGPVKPHQDGAFLYTEPQSVLGMWWPLEACTVTNGCLWAVPGSHRLPVSRRFKRAAGGGTCFEPADPGPPFDLTGAVPLEIPAGSLVLLHSSLVHYSEANESDISRHAYSIHIVEAGKGVVYPADNWLITGKPFPALY